MPSEFELYLFYFFFSLEAIWSLEIDVSNFLCFKESPIHKREQQIIFIFFYLLNDSQSMNKGNFI